MKNIIKPKKDFALGNSNDAYVVKVHMENLMMTLGEERVKDIVKHLFLEPSKTKTKKKAVGQ